MAAANAFLFDISWSPWFPQPIPVTGVVVCLSVVGVIIIFVTIIVFIIVIVVVVDDLDVILGIVVVGCVGSAAASNSCGFATRHDCGIVLAGCVVRWNVCAECDTGKESRGVQ